MSIQQEPSIEPLDDAPVATAAVESAGFWIRAAARVVDWLVLNAVGGVTALLGAVVLMCVGRATPDVIERLSQNTFIGWLGGVVALILYHSVFEKVAGSTIGKRLLGIQVVSTDFSSLNFKQAFGRSVSILIDGLFFGAIAAGEMKDSAEKQRIGDRWARTRVVRRRSLPPSLRPSGLQYFAALVMAINVAFLVFAGTQMAEYLLFARGA